MNSATPDEPPVDQPLLDTTPYGYGPKDSVSDPSENAAVTQHTLNIKGKSITYTARAGHLVTTDTYSAQPAAKLFYVSFTVNNSNPSARPVTFFYNGGPGSSSAFLLLGSFGPRRIKTSMPYFTPPAPYTLEDNMETLLDESDLVFVDPVGTGYSSAIAPGMNRDFWGVDQDASCIKQFVKRYLTVFNRWNSPKYLFGESYGTPRTCVLTWMLHEDGVDLNGIVLQSSVLDYAQTGNAVQGANPVGILPTFAADAWFHQKVSVAPPPADIEGFMEEVEAFAMGDYKNALNSFPNVAEKVLNRLSDFLGIPPMVLKYWQLDPATGNGPVFLTSLLLDKGLALGAYDGRVTGVDMGIAEYLSPDSGNNDPTMTAIGGVYTTMWNVYLNEGLKYTATSPFLTSNDKVIDKWDFGHIDPTGAQKGGVASLYTAGDLAAAMSVNPYLKVFSANGYFDAVTPFFQTKLNFRNMPLGSAQAMDNLMIKNYPSGHMIYLDNASRTAMRAHLTEFYQNSKSHAAVMKAEVASEPVPRLVVSQYRRRTNRTPY